MNQIEFDLREIPHAAEESISGYYPVVAHPQKVTAKALYEMISRQCTLTSADIKAVLDAMAVAIGEGLSRGAGVEIPELGYFRPSLGCDIPITDTANMQTARHLFIDNVVFRPKASLKEKMQDVTFVRTDGIGKKVNILSDEELLERIRQFFSTGKKLVMERSDFQLISGYRHTKALQTLRRLSESGLLIKQGSRSRPYYILPNTGE